MKYSEKVMNCLNNPKNMGEMKNPDGIGKAVGKYCGDEMVFFIKINEEGVIYDVKFQTLGCIASVASGSIVSEMIKGKSVEDAQKITKKEIIENLDGLPLVKEHCAEIAEKSMHNALKNYLNKKE